MAQTRTKSQDPTTLTSWFKDINIVLTGEGAQNPVTVIDNKTKKQIIMTAKEYKKRSL